MERMTINTLGSKVILGAAVGDLPRSKIILATAERAQEATAAMKTSA